MLNEVEFKTEYRTRSEDDPKKLVQLALPNSKLYRRASGYFSSSMINLFETEILEFVSSGGFIELMCSPVMSVNDLLSIEAAYRSKRVEEQIHQEVSAFCQNEELEITKSFIGTLISQNLLDIKIVFYDHGDGIFHDKTGYFKDAGKNHLTFTGSANESKTAFSGYGNFERLTVSADWIEGQKEFASNNVKYVNDIWNENIEELSVINFPNVSKDLLRSYAQDSLEEFRSTITAEKPKAKKKKIDALLPHQDFAIKSWENAGKRGILKHATGSGKTVTALSAIRKHCQGGFPALVTVPSQLLLEQWYSEIREEIKDITVLRCGGGHSRWRSYNLSQLFNNSREGTTGSIILAVNDTASSADFQSKLRNLPNILFVADEVHSLGSRKISSILENNFGFRLGLSATPERYRDPEGTDKIFGFFNARINFLRFIGS